MASVGSCRLLGGLLERPREGDTDSVDDEEEDIFMLPTSLAKVTPTLQGKRHSPFMPECSPPKFSRSQSVNTKLSRLPYNVDNELHLTRGKRLQLQEIFHSNDKSQAPLEYWQRDRSIFDPEISEGSDDCESVDNESLPDLDSDNEDRSDLRKGWESEEWDGGSDDLKAEAQRRRLHVTLSPIKKDYHNNLIQDGYCKLDVEDQPCGSDIRGGEWRTERNHQDLFNEFLPGSSSNYEENDTSKWQAEKGHSCLPRTISHDSYLTRVSRHKGSYFLASSSDSDDEVDHMVTRTRNVNPFEDSPSSNVLFKERKLENQGCVYRYVPHRQLLAAPALWSRPPAAYGSHTHTNEEGVWVRQFSESETIMCGIDESRMVKVVSQYVNSGVEPSPSVYRKLVKQLIHEDKCQFTQVYSHLKMLLSQHPPHEDIPFSWVDVEDAVERLGLKGCVLATGPALALDVLVTALEVELIHRKTTSQRQINKSTAYRWLSPDTNFARIRQIIHWLVLAVHAGEFKEMEESLLCLHLGMQAAAQSRSNHPKSLCVLQRLIELSVAVSRQPRDSTERIANELTSHVMHMPSTSSRRLLLFTISSPLLRFKIVQRVLEDHSPNACYNIGTGFGSSFIEDIYRAFFREPEPPRSSLTPPPTPEEVGGEERREHSVDSCEELAMLLSMMLQDYILIRKGALHEPLSLRMLEKVSLETSRLPPQDIQALENLPSHVSRLRQHLLSLCGDITPRTDSYLTMMTCLTDVVM